MKVLLNNQKEAVEKLAKYKVGALFMEAGTGKTLTAIELIRLIADIDYVMWICPFQAKKTIADEFNKWGFEGSIIGIESIQSSDRIYLKSRQHLVNSKKPVLVVDESIKIKNIEAKRTRRLIEMARLIDDRGFRFVLNATPLTRNILDMWAQMEFLSPKILNMTFSQYKNNFCEWVKVTKTIGGKSFVKEFINGYHNLDYLAKTIEPYVYECNLQLDVQQNYKELKYIIDDELKEEYYRLKKKFLNNENLLFKNNNIFLEMTQKMQHTYCNSSFKFDLVANILEKISPQKTIIYCKYKASTKAVSSAFPECKVLTYGKHSYSLNLQDYNNIIYFDKTWDYAQRKQSSHRIYRQGQNDNCNYYDLTGDVGLEKLISENVRKKISMVEYFKTKTTKELKKVL